MPFAFYSAGLDMVRLSRPDESGTRADARVAAKGAVATGALRGVFQTIGVMLLSGVLYFFFERRWRPFVTIFLYVSTAAAFAYIIAGFILMAVLDHRIRADTSHTQLRAPAETNPLENTAVDDAAALETPEVVQDTDRAAEEYQDTRDRLSDLEQNFQAIREKLYLLTPTDDEIKRLPLVARALGDVWRNDAIELRITATHIDLVTFLDEQNQQHGLAVLAVHFKVLFLDNVRNPDQLPESFDWIGVVDTTRSPIEMYEAVSVWHSETDGRLLTRSMTISADDFREGLEGFVAVPLSMKSFAAQVGDVYLLVDLVRFGSEGTAVFRIPYQRITDIPNP